MPRTYTDEPKILTDRQHGTILQRIRNKLNGKLDAPSTAGTNGQVLTSDGQGGQAWQTPAEDIVQDVQVNNVSVLQNGVAVIPIVQPDQSIYGLVKPSASVGTAVASNGRLAVVKASINQIKAGINEYLPIMPERQHISVFYGLTKAAGVDMASSSNAVGTYTEEAKAAIRNMLGVQGLYIDLITGTDPVITGAANHRYICGEVYTISITPPGAGMADVVFTSGSTPTVLTIPNTVKMPDWFDATTLESNTIYEILITDGTYGSVQTWAL